MLRNDPAVMYGDFLACNDFNVMEQLNQIDLPVLVITGSEDRMTPAKFGRYLAGSLHNGRLEIVDGAGHMVMLEEPAMVSSLVAEFVGNLA